MKMDGGYITIEQAKELERQRLEKIDKIDKRVEKTVANLRKEGYKFEFKESRTDFIISIGGTEHHVMKIDPFILERKTSDGKLKKRGFHIEYVVKAICN